MHRANRKLQYWQRSRISQDVASPAQQGEEFGQYHCRRPPDLDTVDVKRRHREGRAVGYAYRRREMPRIHELVETDFEDSGDFAVRRGQRRTRRVHRDDRMQPETADRDIERRERTEDAHLVLRERDLLVRLAQG